MRDLPTKRIIPHALHGGRDGEQFADTLGLVGGEVHELHADAVGLVFLLDPGDAGGGVEFVVKALHLELDA